MKKNTALLFVFWLLWSLLGNYAGVLAQEETSAGEFVVAYASYPEDANKFDVQVYNRAIDNVVFSKTIENLNINHYHSYEVHNGNLYVLKEVGDTSGDDWGHELWVYSVDGERLLFSSKGIDFRVAPDESLIAMTYTLPSDQFRYVLGFLDPEKGELVQEFGFDHIDEMLTVGLENWSDDSSNLWVNYSHGPTPAFFASVNTGDWSIVEYSPGEHNIGADYALEPNTGQVVYSDHPVFFEVMSAQAFKESGEIVSLYLHNLNSGVAIKIAESAAKPFDPFWIDDQVIGYNDPAGDGSSISSYTVLSGEIKKVEATQSGVFPVITPPGFEMYIQTLVADNVPPILPAEFPLEAGISEVYPYVYVAEAGKYESSLDYGEDCQGVGACHYGSILVKKTRFDTPMGTEYNPINPWVSQKVILDKGIQGYFVESVCGVNCSDAQVFWVYAGFEYMIGLKGAPVEPVVALANAAIANSIP